MCSPGITRPAWLGQVGGVFDKLLVNFTRWVNRQDASDKAVFEGGFLGLVHNRLVSPLSDVPERRQPRLGVWPRAPRLG
jgi:hypothetical protein